MTTSSLKPGDLVEVDKRGRRFHARYEGRLGVGAVLAHPPASGPLRIRPLDTRISYRTAAAAEIVGIWHANAPTRRRYHPAEATA